MTDGKEEPKQRLDGSKLPEYSTIKDRLGTFGSYGTSEENGWFLKGGAVPREKK